VSEQMSDTKNFEVITAAAKRLTVSPGRSYCSWSQDQRIGSSGNRLRQGRTCRRFARSHRLDPSQLFVWRRKALASGMVAPLAQYIP
jgi:transposase